MGPFDELLKMIPGANKMKGLNNIQIDEKQIAHVEAIIHSMTKKKRQILKLLMQVEEDELQKERNELFKK